MREYVRFGEGRTHSSRRSLLLLLALALAGCQQGPAPALPPRTSAPAVSSVRTPSPSPSTPHDVIVTTYTRYWSVLAEAGRSSPDEARRLLKPYVQGAYLDHLVDGVRRMEEQGREPYGQMIPGVKEVRVGGKYAEVVDCQDMSQAGMADRRTHRLIPESAKGRARADIRAKLQQSSDGRWRLIGLNIKGATCTPPSQ